MAVAQTTTKVYSQEELDEQVRKAVEGEKRKAGKAEAGWEIIAPVADPEHPIWHTKDAEGKLNNPYKLEYPKEFGTFDLQIAPFTTADGKEYPPSSVPMYQGKGFTANEHVAKWVQKYYEYQVRPLKEKDDLTRAMELVNQG